MGKVRIVWYFITNYNIQIKYNYSTETQSFLDILSLITMYKLKKIYIFDSNWNQLRETNSDVDRQSDIQTYWRKECITLNNLRRKWNFVKKSSNIIIRHINRLQV
jgi:hypothetical protein